MKHFLYIFLFSLGISGYSQNYRYGMSIIGVSEPSLAKLTIENLRDLLGVTMVSFDDASDEFILFTHLNFEPSEMFIKLEENGVYVDGIITKINVE